MENRGDSKEQLINNLIELRQRVDELQALKDQKKIFDQRLDEAKAMFDGLFDFAPDAILLIDRLNRITRVNIQTEKTFGFSRQELVGKPHDILVPERFVEKHKEEMKNYMSNPQVRLMKPGIELYGRKKDGSEFPVEISLGPLSNEKDSLILSVVRDISEYHKQKEAILESEGRYRTLVEMAPDGVTIQSEGTFTFANATAAKILGAESPQQLIGKSIWDFVHPEYKEIVEKRFRTMTEEEKGVPLIEEKIIRLDGTPIVVEVVSAPFIYRGKVATQTWFRDITWRKAAEQALRESEERYRQIVEHSPLAISIHTEGKVIFANSTTLRTFGAESLEEFIGKPVVDFIHPDFRQLSLERIKIMVAENKPAPIIESKFLRLDGTTFIGETISIPSTYGGQHVIITFIHDITRDKEAEEKLKETMTGLERSNRELEQFAYVASHDLREPLRMMVSFSQLLEKRYKDKLDKDAKEFIGFIVDGATRMSKMIDDLLDFSRVGRMGKPIELTDYNKSLSEALSNLKVAIQERGAVISHDELPSVMGDSGQITRLFQNLIGNAIKFCKDRTPKVHISAQLKAKEWIFSVRDNGIGIAPEHFERIFSIFVRIHSRGEYSGSGIGLAICNRIVERHGGRMWVESELGKGSTFYFTIPVTRQEKK